MRPALAFNALNGKNREFPYTIHSWSDTYYQERENLILFIFFLIHNYGTKINTV